MRCSPQPSFRSIASVWQAQAGGGHGPPSSGPLLSTHADPRPCVSTCGVGPPISIFFEQAFCSEAGLSCRAFSLDPCRQMRSRLFAEHTLRTIRVTSRPANPRNQTARNRMVLSAPPRAL